MQVIFSRSMTMHFYNNLEIKKMIPSKNMMSPGGRFISL